MKGITGFVVGAVALAAAGAVCVVLGNLDRDLARAAEQVATLDYQTPAGTFERAEQYLGYISRLPGVGAARLRAIRSRKAALKYWQGDYAALVPDKTDPTAGEAQDNLDLQFINAQAIYRAGQAQAKDRQTLLSAVDGGIAAYLAVLKNATYHEPAAYNYEYLVRLRDEIEKPRSKPDLSPKPGPQPLGRAGTTPRSSPNGDFKMLVPLDAPERDKSAAAGKAAPIKRKG